MTVNYNSLVGSTSIPRTANFMALINSRLRFFNGSDVHVGDEFPLGWEECSIQRNHCNTACRAIRYDGEHLFVLHKKEMLDNSDDDIITTLCGDAAGYNGRLLVDRMHRQYNISRFEQKIQSYMEKHGIAEYTSDVARHALWMKMMPGNVVEDCVRVYELSRSFASVRTGKEQQHCAATKENTEKYGASHAH